MDGSLLRTVSRGFRRYWPEQNTAIIVAGDHGTNVGERGRFGKYAPVYEQEIHIPLFIKTPEGDAGRSSAIFQPQDFFATVAIWPVRQFRGTWIATISSPPHGKAVRDATTRACWHCPGMGKTARIFTVFDQDGYLEWQPELEDCMLTPYGSLDNTAGEHPDRVQNLQAAGLLNSSAEVLIPF